MTKARELFNEVFENFIWYGRNDYHTSRPIFGKQRDKGYIGFLFKRNRHENRAAGIEFLNRILYYLSLDDPEAYDDVIDRLNHPKRSEDFDMYSLLSILADLLQAETSDQIQKIVRMNINTLNRLHSAYSSAVASTYVLTVSDIGANNYDPFGMLLRNTAEFVILLHPGFFAEPFNMFLIDSSTFRAVMVDLCMRHSLPIEIEDYFGSALDVDDSRMYYRVTKDIYTIFRKKWDLQTAYDVLYSWIEQKSCGGISYSPEKHTGEAQWRKEHPEAVLTLWTNMCYLCYMIAGLQNPASWQGRAFRRVAISCAKKVLEAEYSFRYPYGRCMHVLRNMREYGLAADAAAKLLDTPPTLAKKGDEITELRHLSELISARIGWFCQPKGQDELPDSRNSDGDNIDQLRELVERFIRIIMKPGKKNSNIDADKQILDICRTIASQQTEAAESIIVFLLCIRHLALEIKRELRYVGCIQTVYDPRIGAPECKAADKVHKPSAIAYYTTLGNLKYLMEPVYAKDPKSRPVPIKDLEEPAGSVQGKNCLTMMHAHYMNDPSEGITLPQALSGWIDERSPFKNLLFRTHAPSDFREQLLDGQFVFLKSFTDIIDQLNMWSIYSSDRNGGSDSNGCCICIAPETFEMMLQSQIIEEQDDQDDLQLYKVAYLRNNQIANKDQQELSHYFELLKTLVQELNDTLVRLPNRSGQLLDRVVAILQEILTPIIFLFKDASYRAEHELRLIVTRSRTREDMERISKTPQTPPKLYVNPYHQIFVEQIILGPKVKQPDVWIPHLQFELTKMWEHWPEKQYGKRVPSVRKSSINYRD